MNSTPDNASLEALQDIRSIMDRSARFVSLSGMSGVWAGAVALVGAFAGYQMLQNPNYQYIGRPLEGTPEYFDVFTIRLMMLGVAVFIVALAGAFYFTYKKARKHSHTLWNNAS